MEERKIIGYTVVVEFGQKDFEEHVNDEMFDKYGPQLELYGGVSICQGEKDGMKGLWFAQTLLKRERGPKPS